LGSGRGERFTDDPPSPVAIVRRPFPARRIARWVLILAIPGAAFIHPAIAADETLKNVALHLIPREILFISVQGGVWTSVRLDAGERIPQRGLDGNVAAVLTSLHAIGFSADTGKWPDIQRLQPR
jgi:hypothetical protein